MTKLDVHQHIWTDPLLQALAQRRELPFVRRRNGLTVLFLAGERPYVIDTRCGGGRSPRRDARGRRGRPCAHLPFQPARHRVVATRAGRAAIDAYHAGALSLGERFGVWGAIPLDRPNPADVDHALDRGCVGIALPAGSLASIDAVARLYLVLARLEMVGAPLLVHPGPGPAARARGRAH